MEYRGLANQWFRSYLTCRTHLPQDSYDSYEIRSPTRICPLSNPYPYLYIKSKSVNTWNDLNKLFIKKQFVNQKRFFL